MLRIQTIIHRCEPTAEQRRISNWNHNLDEMMPVLVGGVSDNGHVRWDGASSESPIRFCAHCGQALPQQIDQNVPESMVK